MIKHDALTRRIKKARHEADAKGDPRLSLLLEGVLVRLTLLETQLENLQIQTRRKIKHDAAHTRFYCPMCDDIDAVLAELTDTQ